MIFVMVLLFVIELCRQNIFLLILGGLLFFLQFCTTLILINMLNLDNFYKARYVLSHIIRRTDLIHAPNINVESDIYLKPENLQTTGSFKLRGACYKISQLSDEEKMRGVIACSAGNHAQGVALGASAHGIKSLICLPEGAPMSKVEATRHYGAEIRLVPGVYDDAFQEAIRLRDEHGYTFIHPFDDEHVIAGQGTIGLELLDQLPDLDAVIVPIGGGGLISGIAFAIKSLNPRIKVYGVQAQGAPSMLHSLEQQCRTTLSAVSTIADGIAVKEPGHITYDTCCKYVDEIVTVTEDEICAAILALLEQQKLIAEGAGAVSVAAAMFNKVPIKGKKTVCIVSGGNIDVTILSRVISRGMAKSGRVFTFSVELEDKPGQMVEVSKVVAQLGGNVIRVQHERNDDSQQVNSCELRMTVETRNEEHIESIRQALLKEGFNLV
jgi:threonine dehydratase